MNHGLDKWLVIFQRKNINLDPGYEKSRANRNHSRSQRAVGGVHNHKVYHFFALRCAIFQACIAARILSRMQDSEERKKEQHETRQTRVLTTAPQRRRCRIVNVLYLIRVNEKKEIDWKKRYTLLKGVKHPAGIKGKN